MFAVLILFSIKQLKLRSVSVTHDSIVHCSLTHQEWGFKSPLDSSSAERISTYHLSVCV